MKIIYTPESIVDLQRLREFISEKNPAAAKAVSTRLIAGITRLKTFPRMGLEVSQAPDPDLIRDLILGKYTVRYLIDKKIIHILKVWHHKEDEGDL